MAKREAAAASAAEAPVSGGEESHTRVADPAAPAIYRAIGAVMRDLEAIGKARRNTQQGYSFRGIDDVYNELHGHLARHGVFTVPRVLEDRTEERTTGKGSVLIYRVLRIRCRFYAADGSFVDAVVIGEGMDSGDKASNKAMAVAHKYALMQVFAIPTEDQKDPEHESHDVPPRQVAATPPPRTEPQGRPPQRAADPRAQARSDAVEALEKQVAPHAVYVGALEQKKILAGIFARNGVTAPDDMKAIGADAVAGKVTMGQLADWVAELVHGEPQEEPPQDGLGKPLAPGERPTA